jgi:hypothetical protein
MPAALPDRLRTLLRQASRQEESQPASDPQFVEDLIRRGEAVRLKPGQALPPGATHEVVDADGKVTVIRRRLSAAKK